jgi:hypothetical protein
VSVRIVFVLSVLFVLTSFTVMVKTMITWTRRKMSILRNPTRTTIAILEQSMQWCVVCCCLFVVILTYVYV